MLLKLLQGDLWMFPRVFFQWFFPMVLAMEGIDTNFNKLFEKGGISQQLEEIVPGYRGIVPVPEVDSEKVKDYLRDSFFQRPTFDLKQEKDLIIQLQQSEEKQLNSSVADEVYRRHICYRYRPSGKTCATGIVIILPSSGGQLQCRRWAEYYRRIRERQLEVNCISYGDCRNVNLGLLVETIQGFIAVHWPNGLLKLIPPVQKDCGSFSQTVEFEVKDLSRVKNFILKKVKFTNYLSIYLNNQLIYQLLGEEPKRRSFWGTLFKGTFFQNPCENIEIHDIETSLDLHKFLQEGINTLQITSLFTKKYPLELEFYLDNHCCQKHRELWRESHQSATMAGDICWPLEGERICLDANKTFNLEGKIIKAECWFWRETEICRRRDSYLDYCKSLAQLGGCSLLSTNCGHWGPDKVCDGQDSSYQCGKATIPIGPLLQMEYTLTSSSAPLPCTLIQKQQQCQLVGNRCQDAFCSSQREDYSCVDGVSIDPCQGVDLQNCLLEQQECLDITCSSEKLIYHCPVAGVSIASNNWRPEQLVPDPPTPKPTNNSGDFVAVLAALESASGVRIKSPPPTDFLLLTGESFHCSKKILEIRDCCRDDGWANFLITCSLKAQLLLAKRQANQCVLVGEYCSSRENLTNVCLEKTEGLCCFPTKLARLLGIAARQQLSLGWGTPENPDCRGLTAEELSSINFSRVDFSTISEDLQRKVSSGKDFEYDFSQRVRNAVENKTK
jgi:hypothetical protein